MRKKDLLKMEPAAPEKETEIYAESILQEIDDREICEIDLYEGKKLLVRYFADAEKRQRLCYFPAYQKWTGEKLENAAADVTGQSRTSYWTSSTDIVWLTKEEKERVLDYLDTYSISAWEAECDRRERWNAADRKAARIDAEVDEFGLIPDEVERWIMEKLLPEECIFLRRAEGLTEWTCTACGESGKTSIPLKIGRMNRCPACGREVKGKKAGVSVSKSVPVIVFQTNEARTKYCEKQLKGVVTWSETGKTIDMPITNIAIMKRGEHVGHVYYGQDTTAEEYRQNWWTRNTGAHFRESWVYPHNLDEIIGPMMHAERSGIMEIIKDRPINVNTWLYYGWIETEVMEYMLKRGLYALAAETMESYGFSVQMEEALAYIRDEKEAAHRIAKLDGGYTMLEWIMQNDNIGLKDEDMIYLQQKGWGPETSGIERALENGKSVRKICNYLRKNKANSSFLIMWSDYLNMARQEGQNLRDDIVMFARDVRQRHDDQVRRISERKDAERAKMYADIDRKIMQNLPAVMRWQWTDGTYQIYPAGCCEDLMRESRELHHCVGTSTTYMERMAAGRTWIFFLRKSEEPAKPFYTIELELYTEKILQWYSAYDRKPDEAVIKAVLDRWQKEKKKERKAG